MFIKCTDGTKIEDEESNLLGIILQKMTLLQVDELDLNIKELLSGTSNLTYEELQIILGRTTQTSYLSTDLDQKLRARKQNIFFVYYTCTLCGQFWLHLGVMCMVDKLPGTST